MYYFAFALLLAALLGSLAFAGAALIHLWQTVPECFINKETIQQKTMFCLNKIILIFIELPAADHLNRIFLSIDKPHLKCRIQLINIIG